MMLKRLFLLFVFLGSGFIAVAQELAWSSLSSFRNKTAYNAIIGANEHGYYVLRSRSYDMRSRTIIERYRESMGLDFSKRLPDMRGMDLIQAFVQEQNILVWKSRFNAETEKLELLLSFLNAEADAIGSPQLMAAAKPRHYNDEGDFNVYTNALQSHYLILYSEMAPQRKSYLNMIILNSKLEPMSNKQILLDFDDKDFRVDQALLDASGNAYVIISGVNSAQRRGTSERIGVFLHALTVKGSYQSHYLNLEDYFLHDAIMAMDEVNGRLLVSALYSNKSLNLSKGILDFAIRSSDLSLIHHRVTPFTQNFIRDIGGEKAAEAWEELPDFELRFMVTRSDGGFILFAEEFSIMQQSYTYYVNGIAQVSSRSVYNYGKISVLAFGSNGQAEWSRVISKGQSSVNDFGYYSSFTICKRKEQIHVLFNDKLKGNGSSLNITLHSDDTFEETSLFGNLGSSIAIVPSEAKQIDANTLLIPTSKDRKFAFVKILF